MKRAVRLAFALAAAIAASAPYAADPAPAAARFYPLVGKWAGTGALGVPGQPAAPLKLALQCRKVSGGAAVLCEMRADGKGMKIRETDLFGVNPATGQGHWYSVTNMGETHDHAADWPDAKTMKATHAWTQDGKRMQENVTMRFASARQIEFQSVVSQEGAEVGSFKGTLKR